MIASFLPWARTVDLTLFNPETSYSSLQSAIAMGSFSNGPLTAWQGSFTIGGYSLPNWLVVISALGFPFLVNRPLMGLAISLLSLLHLGLFALTIMAFGMQTLGIGFVLTLIIYLVALGLFSWRCLRVSQRVHSS